MFGFGLFNNNEEKSWPTLVVSAVMCCINFSCELSVSSSYKEVHDCVVVAS